MSARRSGLPVVVKMRHDAHYVEEMISRSGAAIGRMIPIEQILANAEQPRKDQGDLHGLTESVREKGVLEPLLVRHLAESGKYMIISGERRYLAARAAGLREVPCIEKDVEEAETLELALIENIQRQELNPVEEANAYKKLIDSLHLTQEEIAERVGRDRTFITNYLRILKLPAEIQSLIEREKLSFGHARALLAINDAQLQRRFAQRIIKNSWSVRETERLVKHLSQEKADSRKHAAAAIDPNLRAAEAKLRRHLQTQVRILPASTGTPGRIEIEYYDMHDLNRLYDLLMQAPPPLTSASVGASL